MLHYLSILINTWFCRFFIYLFIHLWWRWWWYGNHNTRADFFFGSILARWLVTDNNATCHLARVCCVCVRVFYVHLHICNHRHHHDQLSYIEPYGPDDLMLMMMMTMRPTVVKMIVLTMYLGKGFFSTFLLFVCSNTCTGQGAKWYEREWTIKFISCLANNNGHFRLWNGTNEWFLFFFSISNLNFKNSFIHWIYRIKRKCGHMITPVEFEFCFFFL